MKELVITRHIKAPLEKVWKAWTEENQLAKWWGPKGFEMKHVKLDLKPGGLFHYGMSGPDGSMMWGRFMFKEIEPSQKLVYTSSFSDEKGEIIRAPFSENWPLEVLNTLTLEDENGQTKLTLRGGPINPTEEEAKLFESMTESMNEGFGGTFEQLEEYLGKMA